MKVNELEKIRGGGIWGRSRRKNSLFGHISETTSLKIEGLRVNIEDQKEKYLLEVRCRAKKIVNIFSEDHQKNPRKRRGGVAGINYPD